jgi:lysophospholipase L1-like esterase
VWLALLGCLNACHKTEPKATTLGDAVRAGAGASAMTAAGVRWVGRVDASGATAIKFAWSGSGFVGTFTGPAVSVKLKTVGGGDIFFQPLVDGALGRRFSVGAHLQTVDIASNLAPGPHRVELYRETEGKGFGYSVFSGFARGVASAPPAASGRLIEVIGDSISAGFGNLGAEQHPGYSSDPNGGCPFSTATESAYQAYGAVAARAVGADASVLAGSGWGMYSDIEGDRARVMPALFENVLGERPAPAWTFAVMPQAVVINLGTNDATAHNLTADKFKPAYAAFLGRVRAKYPSALVLCAVGSMLSGAARDQALIQLSELVAERAAHGDAKVKLLDLGQQDVLQGTGCRWHPNVAEDQRMAGILVAALKANLGW